MINKKIRNIIFLSIDSLRYDRLGSSGYPVNLTPTFDFFSKNGINCTNAFTHACGTQFAFPSIFTSTLPLDNNGYDKGIKNREKSFVEILRDNGFHTIGIGTSHWIGKFFFYDRGFNEFHQVFGISGFWKNIRDVFLDHLIKIKKKCSISDKEFNERISELFKEAITYALEYHDENLNQQRFIAKNNFIHSYDYKKIKKFLLSELEFIKSNQYSLDRIDNLYFNLYELGCVPYKWTGLDLKFGFNDKIIDKFKKYSYDYGLKENAFKTPSAGYLKKVITSCIDKNPGKPFFLWTHFLDIHCKNYTDGKVQLFPSLKNFNDINKLGKKYNGDVVYDACLKYLDDQLKSIYDFLNKKNLIDNTLIIITGDHGRPAGFPKRGLKSIANFYDEFVKVPLIFYNPGLKPEKITDLCSSIDIGPSILDFIGISEDKSFKGISIKSSDLKNRKEIIMEHTYKGACDIKNKPIYLSIRTEKYKYIWKEYLADKDNVESKKFEFFDLEKDPNEMINQIDNNDYKSEIENLNRIVEKRYNQIHLNVKEKNQ